MGLERLGNGDLPTTEVVFHLSHPSQRGLRSRETRRLAGNNRRQVVDLVGGLRVFTKMDEEKGRGICGTGVVVEGRLARKRRKIALDRKLKAARKGREEARGRIVSLNTKELDTRPGWDVDRKMLEMSDGYYKDAEESYVEDDSGYVELSPRAQEESEYDARMKAELESLRTQEDKDPNGFNRPVDPRWARDGDVLERARQHRELARRDRKALEVLLGIAEDENGQDNVDAGVAARITRMDEVALVG